MPTKNPPFRKSLLSGTIDFILRYWNRPDITSDYRIGQQIKAAQEALK